MKKISLIIIFSIIFIHRSYSQVFPANNSSLNFTQLMFDYNIYNNLNSYRLILAVDTLDNIFNTQNIIVDTLHTSSSIFIDKKIMFGKKYKWKFYAINAKKKIVYTSPTFYFKTIYNYLIDSNYYRFIFRKNSTANNENFIVLSDEMRTAFNKQGNPIWFLNVPNVNNVRDLVLNNKGTFTFLNTNSAYEVDRLGNILWTAPNDGQVSKDTTEKYHHDFTLLKSGNYMVCGQKLFKGFEEQTTIGISPFSNPNITGSKISSSTIIEYDKDKRVVWFFDLIPELKRNFNIDVGKDPLMLRVGHLNGIDVDEKEGYVYASFKTFNNIFKIRKSNNSIEYIFGNKNINLKDSLKADPNYFAAQHAPILLKNGNLMVFNNNENGKVSAIVELTNPSTYNDISSKIWEYKFDEDGFVNPHSEHLGSVQELNNSSFFVCAGAVNRIFEVNRNKKISWDVITETNVNFNKTKEPNWQPISSYRAFKYSSLYPFYFSIQYNIETFKANKKPTFIIYNKGSENDSYNIKYFVMNNKGNDVQVFLNTETINTNSNKKIEVKMDVFLKNDINKIIIESQNSKQQIIINCKK